MLNGGSCGNGASEVNIEQSTQKMTFQIHIVSLTVFVVAFCLSGLKEISQQLRS